VVPHWPMLTRGYDLVKDGGCLLQRASGSKHDHVTPGSGQGHVEAVGVGHKRGGPGQGRREYDDVSLGALS
jgi:hypothetical protein